MILIKLIIQSGENPIDIEVEECTTIEEIVKEYQGKLPYRVLAAKVNHRVRELTREITEPCTITFLDMRNATVSRIYQNSVSFVYLKAINEVLGNVRVEIQNSLNKGIYTEIKTRRPLTLDDVAKIEEKMRELVEADIPFERKILTREDFQTFSDHNHEEKRRILKSMPHVEKVPVYSVTVF